MGWEKDLLTDSIEQSPNKQELAYRRFSKQALSLGEWRLSEEKVLRVFFFPQGQLEAFVLRVADIAKRVIEERISGERIRGGINGLLSSQDLSFYLQQKTRDFVPVLTGSAKERFLHFLPRLEGAAGSVKERESLMKKLLFIQENPAHPISSEEFLWALKISQKCDQELLPVKELFTCAALLSQALFTKGSLQEEERLKVYDYHNTLYALLKEKGLLQTHLEEFLHALSLLRSGFFQKELRQDGEKVLHLAMHICKEVKAFFPYLQLYREGGRLFLEEARKEKQFSFYERAAHHFVSAYHLTKVHSSLDTFSQEVWQELLQVQGEYLKQNTEDFSTLIDEYQKRKCVPLYLKELPLEERKKLLGQIEKIADLLLVRGCHTAAYRFYRIASDLSNDLLSSPETPSESFSLRRFSIEATSALNKEVPHELLKNERRFRERLQEIREKSALLCKESSYLTTKQQKEVSQLYCHLIQEVFQECLLLLSKGKNPRYALVGLGSLSRGEMCPFSDIELALFMEEASLESVLKEQAQGDFRLQDFLQKVKLKERETQLSFEEALQGQLKEVRGCRAVIERIKIRQTQEDRSLLQIVQEEREKKESLHFVEEITLWENKEERISLDRFLQSKLNQIEALEKTLEKDILGKVAQKEQETKEFFHKVAEFFNLFLISFGESEVSFGVVPGGFHLDKDNNPLELCATIEQLALRQKEVEEVKAIQLNALRTVLFIDGDRALYQGYQNHLKQILDAQGGMVRKQHAQANIQAYRTKSFEALESEDKIDVKQDLLRLPVFVFETLCLYHGIYAADTLSEEDPFFHTVDKIELLCQKGVFPTVLKDPLEEFLQSAFALRWKVHLQSQKENDHYLPSTQERQDLIKKHKLVIEPLKAALEKWVEDLSFDPAPYFACAYLKRGEELISQQQHQEALGYLEKAYRIKEDLRVAFLLGRLYFFLEDFSKAEQTWQSILPFLEKGNLIEKLKDFSKSDVVYLQKEKCAQLLLLTKEQIQTKNALGVSLQSLGEEFFHAYPLENTASFADTLDHLLQTGKTPRLQSELKRWLSILFEKGSPLSYLQSAYFSFSPTYQTEMKNLLLSSFSDKLAFLEGFICEEGYIFAADVKREKWLKELARWRKDTLSSGEKQLPYVEGLHVPKGYLLGSITQALFQGEEFKNAVDWGNRFVSEAAGSHFKKNPECPGDEYAVFLLNHLLTGQGSPPVEVLKVRTSSAEHLILASQTIAGKPLHRFLIEHENALSCIDKKQFSQMVLLALLTDPEDGKADNYIASYSQDAAGKIASFQIIGVDNDHVFVKPFIQKGVLGGEQLFIKTILFCFEEMKEPLHPEVVADYLKLDMAAVLQQWLINLSIYNLNVEKLLGEELLERYWRDKILVPFFMHPEQVVHLYEKMIRLHRALEKGIQTPLELLKLLNLKLGTTYEEVLKIKQFPQKRFEMLTAKAYNRTKDASQTLTTTAQIKQYTFKDSLKTIRQFAQKGCSPEEGLKILKGLQQEMQLKVAVQDQWEKNAFDKVLTTPFLEELLAQRDWSTLAAEKIPTFLQKIAQAPFRRIVLRNFQKLEDKHLETILQGCRHPITEESELHKLNLQGCVNLTSRTVETINKYCDKLKKLSLKATSIEVAIFKRGFWTERDWKYLRVLDLSECPRLKKLEIGLSSLERLNLLGDAALEQLSLNCPKLYQLNLKGCSKLIQPVLGPSNLITPELFDVIRNLQENKASSINLKISSCFQGEALLYALRMNHSLENLQLEEGETFPEASLKGLDLKENRHLKSLEVKSSNLEELGLEGNLNLQKLILTCPKIYKIKLKGCEQLNSFLLSPNSIFDSHLLKIILNLQNEKVGGNQLLTRLDLRNNKLSRKKILALTDALKGNQTLKFLDLGANNIGLEGARALADAFRGNQTLTSLDLGANKIGLEGTMALAEVFKGNQSLTSLGLSENAIGLEGIRALAKAFRENQVLKNLDLGSNKIGLEGALVLADAFNGNQTLTSLCVKENEIGLKGARALAEAFIENQTLMNLDLELNKIGSEGILALVEFFQRNKTLTSLNLGANEIDHEGALALAYAFKGNQTLKALNLELNKIGPKGARALAEVFKENQSLTSLSLRKNAICVGGARALARAFKGNQTLQSMNLGENGIGSWGARALAEAFIGNQTLANLDFYLNGIDQEGARALAEALKGNQSLTSLDLIGNKIGQEGAQALAEAFKGNKTLRSLYLYSNDVGSKGAQALAEALKENQTLTNLDLGANKIGREGVQALAEAFKGNQTLVSLNLGENAIDSEGARALAEAFKENHTLTSLDLYFNEIDLDGALALAETFKGNYTLTNLDLGGNKIGSE